MPKVKINTPAPNFSLDDFRSEKFILSELRGKSNLLLVFNRGFA